MHLCMDVCVEADYHWQIVLILMDLNMTEIIFHNTGVWVVHYEVKFCNALLVPYSYLISIIESICPVHLFLDIPGFPSCHLWCFSMASKAVCDLFKIGLCGGSWDSPFLHILNIRCFLLLSLVVCFMLGYKLLLCGWLFFASKSAVHI